ncbi:hypothetical protein BaRGS_00027480 [Batillaria attramentaria]|uniref:Ig-like domain-containing protein n=1 Tax=Batillaria attramentaria TaxID=370345 RepID=A0ABD0K1E0_9CAEN
MPSYIPVLIVMAATLLYRGVHPQCMIPQLVDFGSNFTSYSLLGEPPENLSCVTTGPDTGYAWTVDLKSTFYVKRVRLGLHPTEAGSVATITVDVATECCNATHFHDDCYITCTVHTLQSLIPSSVPTGIFDCSQKEISARYVRIRHGTDDATMTSFTLCNVQIYGCATELEVTVTGYFDHQYAPTIGCKVQTSVKLLNQRDRVNEALGKPAYQVATSLGGTADRAVDGSTSGVWADGTCTHTTGSLVGTHWWEVDLQLAVPVRQLVVYSRTDACCVDRLRNVTILVGRKAALENGSTAVMYETCAYHGEQFPAVTSLTCTRQPLCGQFVRVEKPDNGGQVLTLCEVEVYSSLLSAETTTAISTEATTEVSTKITEPNSAQQSTASGEYTTIQPAEAPHHQPVVPTTTNQLHTSLQTNAGVATTATGFAFGVTSAAEDGLTLTDIAATDTFSTTGDLSGTTQDEEQNPTTTSVRLQDTTTMYSPREFSSAATGASSTSEATEKSSTFTEEILSTDQPNFSSATFKDVTNATARPKLSDVHKVCPCTCVSANRKNAAKLTEAEVEEMRATIQRELQVPTANLSRQTRRLRSATDNRPSSVGGGVAAIVVMVVVLLLLVSSDLMTVAAWFSS